jgi:hypothetical protein
MAQLFTNNAVSLLNSSISDVDTVIQLSTGDGALFASPVSPDYQLVTLSLLSDPTVVEVVKVTSRTGDNLTVTRAQEGTSAIAWTAVLTQVSGRLTAGALNLLPQNNASGVDSICLNASNANNTGTDWDKSNLTTWAASTQVFAGNVRKSTANTRLLICVGSGITAGSEPAWPTSSSSYTDGTAKWTVTTGGSESVSCVTMGDAGALFDRCVSIGDQVTVAAGSEAVAIGDGATAGGSGTVAIGRESVAVGTAPVAVGYKAKAYSTNAVAVGYKAASVSGVCIGNGYWGTVHQQGAGTVEIAAESSNHLLSFDYAGQVKYIPFVGFDDWWYPGSATPDSLASLTHSTREITFVTPLGIQAGDATWSATTTYKHGQSVRPTTPNGYVYTAYIAGVSAEPSFYYSSATSGGSEPTWPTSDSSSVMDGDIEWICVDPSNQLFGIKASITRGVFIPTKCGVITTNCSTSATTNPYFSFGVEGNLTKWLGSTEFTKLTGNYSGQEFDPTNTEGYSPTVVNDYCGFGCALTTAGTGLDCTARMYVRGYVVQDLF